MPYPYGSSVANGYANVPPTVQPTLPPTPSPAPGERRLPAAVQALLVIGGLGVCVSLGILFTRKRK